MIGGKVFTDRTTLIKGGYVLTLDPALGDMPNTDVLIDGEKIAAVGPEPERGPARQRHRRAQPHRHAGLRRHAPAYVADAGARRAAELHAGRVLRRACSNNIGIQYRAEDVYIANLMGALEAINAGITTLLDWSHVNNTPEHADAADRRA